MELYAVKTETVKVGDNIADVIIESAKKQNLQLQDNDIIVLTSKILAYAQGRMAKLADIEPSANARELAEKYSLPLEFAELIIHEADKIYGGVERAVLTLKDGVLTANAGIDNKNAPNGYVALWPKDPEKWADKIRREIREKTGKRTAVLVIDSGLAPLRKGTVGIALAVSGFKPLKDYRKEKDIYGKPILITQNAVADSLACAAHLLMGEAAEKTPIVLIRNAPVEFEDKRYGSRDMMMAFEECLFMGSLKIH